MSRKNSDRKRPGPGDKSVRYKPGKTHPRTTPLETSGWDHVRSKDRRDRISELRSRESYDLYEDLLEDE